MKPKTHTLLAAAAFGMASAILSPQALAEDVSWIGDTDANLATGANWSTNPNAPVSGDGWIFDAPGTAGTTLTNDLANSTAFEVAGITFGSTATGGYSISGGTFTLTGNITNTGGAGNQTIGSNIQVSGSRILQLNGGGTVAGDVTLSGNLTGSGSLTQQAGNGGAKSFTFSGDNSGFTGSFTQTNDGSNRTAFSSAASGSASAAWTFNRNVAGGVALNFTNSTIDFGSLSGGGFIRANNVGTVTVSVGALNTDTTFSGIFQQGNAALVLAVTKTGTGMLTLSGNSTHVGGATISNGKLQITNGTNTLGSGTTNVSGGAGATLGGTGTTVGNVNVTNGSHLAVGSITTGSNFGSAGILSLATSESSTLTLTDAVLDFDLSSLAATGNDMIMTRQLALGSTLQFSFNLLNGFLQTGTAYTLINSVNEIDGFDPANISTGFSGVTGLEDGESYAAVYSVNGTNDLQVTFTVIPEPGAALLGGIGVLALLRRRRR